MKCIKCYKNISNKNIKNNLICQDCINHGLFIEKLFEEAKNIFNKNDNTLIEKSDIYSLLLNIFFIIQDNPKIAVYKNIINFLIASYSEEIDKRIDKDILWSRIKSTRNINKLLVRMQEIGVIQLEINNLTTYILSGPVMRNFINKIYLSYKTQEQSILRTSAVLTMYVILYELVVYSHDITKEDIFKDFESHPPRVVWVTTQFLLNELPSKKKREFTEEEILKFMSKRMLSPRSIQFIISSLKATNPDTIQKFIENIEHYGNDYKFIIDNKIFNYIEMIYSSRMREHE
ncbi:MAG: hypothetical protein ACPLW7_00220 [Minisyncoccia bacterium]|jgi:hypothetical protein